MELYCDYSATTPILPEVLVSMMPYLIDKYGNPSSIYTLGREAKIAVEDSRNIIANILGCNSEEIIFTSGGTEGDNLAIKGVAQSRGKDGLYITSKIEHPAVLNCFKELEDNGYDVIYLDVTKDGIVKVEQLMNIINTNKKINFVSIMYANNELGVVQPVDVIGDMLKRYDPNITFHTDAVQAIGKRKISLKDSNIDILSASGHKFGAPKGIGFIYIKNGVELKYQNLGGGQEFGKRSGTENVANIVGISKALEVHNKMLSNLDEVTQLQEKESYLLSLLSQIQDAKLNTSYTCDKITGILNIRFKDVSAQSLLLYLDDKNICISAGSACHSDSDTPSHVLKAIGLTDEEALSSVRISFDNTITNTEIEYLAKCIKNGVDYIRQM